jgi:hypothetical protein
LCNHGVVPGRVERADQWNVSFVDRLATEAIPSWNAVAATVVVTAAAMGPQAIDDCCS